MPKRTEQVLLTNGDLIVSKLGLLVFLGVFLLGLGAGQALWTASYRAFFVWLAFSLLAGGARVAWKYNDYQRRERELLEAIERSKQQLMAREEETRKRQQQLNTLFEATRRVPDEQEENADETEDEPRRPVIPGSRHH
ncbi:MAG: hypothetical protein KDC10_09500 [Calditrichaeota bacterium]|nr:hypothetical protein [Candidatus Cloacimonadota bacterium]MCB1047423.1 hypothetical protein [Calditrichota bacterium]MCB9475044.1 hypothetical protein [Candidatus Delongbacteria bacterium]